MPLSVAMLGAPEFLIIALVVLALVGFIWGLVDAIQRGQTGWWVAVLVGWIFGLGWLIGWIYLILVRPGLREGPT
ncbi:MAG: hypothetical protein R3A49_13210 [Acidimicrobiia bacterium]